MGKRTFSHNFNSGTKRLDMNYGKLWKIIIFTLLISLSSTVLSLADEVEDILKYSFDSGIRANLEGIKESKIYTSTQIYTFVTREVYQEPDFMYIEYINPPRVRGRILIDDGKRRIEYIPTTGKIRVTPSFFSSQIKEKRERNLKVLLKNFEISQLYEEQILGRPVYTISLSPKGISTPLLKIWIDKKTYFTLRKEKYNLNGEPISLFYYKKIQFNKYFPRKRFYQELPSLPQNPETHPFQTYYSLEEIKRKINFSLSLPEYFPRSYVFQEAELMGDRKTVKLIYTNGIDIVVLFQRPRIDVAMRYHRELMFRGMKMRFREGIYGNTLVWSSSGKTFVLIGELPLDEMLKIARSMK